jgi:hypothetical protein
LNQFPQLCREIGLSARANVDERLEVDLVQGTILRFVNAKCEADCLITFLGVPWHTPDNLMFSNGDFLVELICFDLLIGLKEGEVLVCEQEVDGRICDRRLIHSKYNDEFEHLQDGERIIVRRATTQAEASDIIYIALLNEGVSVLRPVPAFRQDDGGYTIAGSIPDDEEWMFQRGSRVRCELKQLPFAEVLVAVEKQS